VIHQANGGVAAARNAGLDAAVGEYIQFVDSDDWIDPAMTEKLVAKAEECGSDVVQCAYFVLEDGVTPKRSGDFFCNSFDAAKANRRAFYFRLHGIHMDYWIITCMNKLIRRAYLESIHLRFRDMKDVGYEDVLFSMCLFVSVRRVDYIREALYFVRCRPHSLTSSTFTAPVNRVREVIAGTPELEAFCRAQDAHRLYHRIYPLYAFYITYYEYRRSSYSGLPEFWRQMGDTIAQLHQWPLARRYFWKVAFGVGTAQYCYFRQYSLVYQLKTRLIAFAYAFGGPRFLIRLELKEPSVQQKQDQ
jgi:glycosyltransferase involved in cell wall biosynthesis